MATISGPLPKRVKVLDWIRCAAILGMIIHHYHYMPSRINETNITNGVHLPRWVEASGSFARNTFVALMGVSLVLSYQPIRNDEKHQKGVRFAYRRIYRGVILVCAAMAIQLASAILLGERLAIRFGIIHFAAAIVLLGSIAGAITVEIGHRMNRGFRLFVLSAIVFISVWKMLMSPRSFSGVQMDWVPRVSLWKLATGTSIGSTDIHTLDIFTLPRWAPLVVVAASITMILVELSEIRSRSNKESENEKENTKHTQTHSIMRHISNGVTTLSKWGLSIYVWHMILFMVIFFRF